VGVGKHPKDRFHALRRMSATHIGAHRTRQWNERWRSTCTHPGAYFIIFFMTHFQAATTIGLRDTRFSLHPTVVLKAFSWNKWPANDAAGGNLTWLGNKNTCHRFCRKVWTTFVAVGQHERWWWGVGDSCSRPRESEFPWDARSDQYVSCIRKWSEPVPERQRRRKRRDSRGTEKQGGVSQRYKIL